MIPRFLTGTSPVAAWLRRLFPIWYFRADAWFFQLGDRGSGAFGTRGGQQQETACNGLQKLEALQTFGQHVRDLRESVSFGVGVLRRPRSDTIYESGSRAPLSEGGTSARTRGTHGRLPGFFLIACGLPPTLMLICGMLLGGLFPSTAATCPQPGDQPQALEIQIHQETQAADVAPVFRGDFDLFFWAYSGLLREQLRGTAARQWEYWVVLTLEPQRKNKLRITVTAKADNMEVRLGNFALSGALRRARGVAQRSVALWRDPLLGALASGDSSTLDALLPGSRRK